MFLFDALLSNLDAELQVQMRVELAALYLRPKTTMMYVTHDQVEAMTLASHIVVLRAGKIEQLGTLAELSTLPANLFMAGSIGSPRINMLQADVRGQGARWMARLVDFPAFALPDLVSRDARMTICIRPEAVHLGSGEVQTTGTIRLAEYLGCNPWPLCGSSCFGGLL